MATDDELTQAINDGVAINPLTAAPPNLVRPAKAPKEAAVRLSPRTRLATR